MHSKAGTAGPGGTVTFLFTDIEGSTRLLQQIGAAYSTVLEDQQRIGREAFEANGGRIVDTAGDGLFVVFGRARDAFAAAVSAQRALAGHAWPEGVEVRVRMGLHTGEPVISSTGYVGMDVHRAARISAAAHGGQVVLSEATRQLLGDELPEGVSLESLGEHWLKDIPQAERLYQANVAGLRTEFPPLRAAGSARARSLPSRALPLIGRESDLSSICELLLHDDVRLLTLTGTGGTGKTSLAVEAAGRCIRDFRDGVAYVPLAPIAESALVFAAIAQTLAVTPRGGQQPLDAVIDHLRDRRVLLVLDNFEQVVDAAEGVARLVSACPRTKVLATSRFALRLTMEREYPVAPLRTPDVQTAGTAAVLRNYPSVELFAQRAAAVKPGFGLDDESTVAVAEICQRLDGLPLAIELAAARIKLFSPRALLARLDRRLEVLSGGARDLPARHRTLRHAMTWSYDLLEPGEQAVFRRLSVFASAFSVDAAETICQAGGDPGLDALDGVTALIDKSFLQQRSSDEGEPRFAMLETVREFALEQLDASDDSKAIRNAHADLFLSIAEKAASELTGPDQAQWVATLQRELDDLRTAFDWTIRSGDASRALRMGAALHRFFIIRGLHTEGRKRLNAVLALAHDNVDDSVRTRVLAAAAILAFEQSDLADASTLLQQALDNDRRAGNTRGVAETLNHMGWVAFCAGDLERAQTLTEEALALHEERGDKRGIGLSLTNLGGVVGQRGDLPKARQLYERALDLRRESKEARSIAYGALNLSTLLLRVGETERALELTHEAERTLRALGDHQLLSYACFVLGDEMLERGNAEGAVECLEESVALGRGIMHGGSFGLALSLFGEALAHIGQFERARQLAGEAVALNEQGGTYVWLVVTLRALGDVLRLAGDTSEARSAYLRALEIAAPREMRLIAAESLGGLAVLESEAGRHEPALRLAAASIAILEASGGVARRRDAELEAVVTRAKDHLDARIVSRAQKTGKAIRLDHVNKLLD
jgi:predicted ATPase/class 3 adenylate cyclase